MALAATLIPIPPGDITVATTIAQQAGYLARKNKNIAGDGVGDGDGNPILNHEFQLILTD